MFFFIFFTMKRNTITASSIAPSKKSKLSKNPQSLPQSQPQPQPQIQISNKSVEKLLNQNAKILTKLDCLISTTKSLEERVSKLEKVPESVNNEEIIKVIKSVMHII